MNKIYPFNTHKFNLFIQEKWDGKDTTAIKQIIDSYYPNKLFINNDSNWLTIYMKTSGDYSRMYSIDDYINIYPYRHWDPLGMDEDGNFEDIVEIKDYKNDQMMYTDILKSKELDYILYQLKLNMKDKIVIYNDLYSLSLESIPNNIIILYNIGGTITFSNIDGLFRITNNAYSPNLFKHVDNETFIKEFIKRELNNHENI
jgi:hypothetical protein